MPGDGVILDTVKMPGYVFIYNEISDTFFYDKGKEGITLFGKTEPKFESGAVITAEAKLTPIDSIEGDLYAMYPSTWTIDAYQSYFDTTKILMLVSDTTERYIREETIDNNPICTTLEHRTITHIKRSDPVYWMCGYIVREFDERIAERLNPLMKPVYLDLSKNPIPKNIFIWDWKKVE